MYKTQQHEGLLGVDQNQLIREFNYLVEQHFKTKHSIGEHAEMLFKSPKTLTNSFKKLGEKSPLQFIDDRIMLEARRLLLNSTKDVSDAAYELGFNDVQAFNRFLRKMNTAHPQSVDKIINFFGL